MTLADPPSLRGRLLRLLWWPLLAVLLRAGTNLWVSLAVASAATALAYLALLPVLKKFGLIE